MAEYYNLYPLQFSAVTMVKCIGMESAKMSMPYLQTL